MLWKLNKAGSHKLLQNSVELFSRHTLVDLFLQQFGPSFHLLEFVLIRMVLGAEPDCPVVENKVKKVNRSKKPTCTGNGQHE